MSLLPYHLYYFNFYMLSEHVDLNNEPVVQKLLLKWNPSSWGDVKIVAPMRCKTANTWNVITATESVMI